MKTLGTYVGANKRITELDISWNKLKPRAYEHLLTSLSQSRAITHLNLSWNTLFEEEIHREEADLNEKSEEQ